MDFNFALTNYSQIVIVLEGQNRPLLVLDRDLWYCPFFTKDVVWYCPQICGNHPIGIRRRIRRHYEQRVHTPSNFVRSINSEFNSKPISGFVLTKFGRKGLNKYALSSRAIHERQGWSDMRSHASISVWRWYPIELQRSRWSFQLGVTPKIRALSSLQNKDFSWSRDLVSRQELLTTTSTCGKSKRTLSNLGRQEKYCDRS